MIDWFASKLGVIVFVLVVSGILFYFVDVQNSIYSSAVIVQEVNDLGKVIDGLCGNCSTEYDFQEERNVTTSGNLLYVNGIKRTVISEFVDGSVQKKEIVIENANGKIKIK
jgi:hypothetical protein